MKTFKNKLYAVGLMLCGSVPTFLEQDATALVFIGMIAVPLFFAKRKLDLLKGTAQTRAFPFIFALISQLLLRRTMLVKRR